MFFSALAAFSTSILNGDEEVPEYDIFYPTARTDLPYTLKVPTLKDRLTLSSDGKTATLFAPYTTKESGWKDVNKKWHGLDDALCWAASDSNIISWYIDAYEKHYGRPIAGIQKDVEDIFQKFRDNWEPHTGSDPMEGFSWYFTSGFLSGDAGPDNLINENSGGYLKSLDHVGADRWSLCNFPQQMNVFGNCDEHFPFIEDVTGVFNEGDPLRTIKDFSKSIIRHLHYGASVLTILKNNVLSGGGHAVTLWGCDFDAKTGLINKLYLADSDDPYTKLQEAEVKASKGDTDGIELTYYPQGMGDPDPFKKVQASSLLFAPGVVRIGVDQNEADKDASVDDMGVKVVENKFGIAGIVICGVVGIALIASVVFAIVAFAIRRNNKKEEQLTESLVTA